MESSLTDKGIRLVRNYCLGIMKGYEMDFEQASLLQCFVWDYENGYYQRLAKEYYVAKTYLDKNIGTWK